MVSGPWLLLASLAFAGLALGAAAQQAFRRSATASKRADLLTTMAAGLAALSFLSLVLAFLRQDYSIYYVWNYSDASTPLYLRLAGAWAGGAGSLLLWTLAIGLGLLIEQAWRARAKGRGVQESEGPAHAHARLLGLGFFTVLLLVTIQAQPFAPTSEYHLDGSSGFFAHVPCPAGFPDCPTPLDFRASGFGLNPLLQTPFMAIHPPMEFLAYGFTALVTAFGIASIATGDKSWVHGGIFWGRLAWVFYATALGLGALWAYYVLSFGGYWAWDPVEVGDLIPFLALTVLLHAADMDRKGKAYPHYAPFVAALAFPLTLFGTFVTRSSYWISAHAFDVGAAGIIQDPAARLVAIVAGKPQVALVVAALIALLAGIAALLTARFLRKVVVRRARLLTVPAVVLLGAYLTLMLVATFDVYGFLAGGLGLAGQLGRGNALLGIALLGLALVGLPVALFIGTVEDDPEERPFQPRAMAEPDALMSAGVVLLSLGLLLTTALLLIGVNFSVTQLGQFFREREPLIVLPLVLVMTMRLSVKTFGAQRSTLVAFGALGLGLALWAVLPPDLKLLGLGVPPLSIALGAGLQQVLKAAGKASAADKTTQRAGMLVLLASFTGFALWASPPTAVNFAGMSLRVPLELVPFGLAASMASYVLGVLMMQGEKGRLPMLGGICAVLTVGYGLGTLLGLGALALAHRSRDLRPTGISGPFARFAGALKRHKGRLYGTSRWAAHVAILLVFIGYGASAYHASEADFRDLSNPLARGVPVAFHDATLTLVDSKGKDLDGDPRTFEEVTAFVQVRQGGQLLDTVPLTFTWIEKETQYRPSEAVLRGPLADLYLNSNPANLPELHTAKDGWMLSNQRTLFDLGSKPKKFTSDDVDMASFSVKNLPLVAPLWAGAALLPFTMAVTILTAPPRGFIKGAAPAALPAPVVVPLPAPPLTSVPARDAGEPGT